MSPMITITAARSTSFSTYNRAKHSIADWMQSTLNFDVFEHTHAKGTYPNLYTLSCFSAAGATSGAVLSLMACPFELSKICTQVSVQLLSDPRVKDDPKRRKIAASYQAKGPFRCMEAIARNRGISGLYTGLGLHLSEFIDHRISLLIFIAAHLKCCRT